MKAILVIGSNCGSREKTVANAVESLRSIGIVIAVSRIYETPDCLGSGRHYLNAVAALETDLDENALCQLLKEKEIAAGRTPSGRKRGDVPLDIDIVVIDGTVRRPADFNATYFRQGLKQIEIMQISGE